MRKYVVTILVSVLLGVCIVAFAQTYEKESATALKVTASVSTVYDIAKIKERIVDLTDYITLAEAQIIKFRQEIDDLNKLLTEAQKVGIETESIEAVVIP